MLAPDTAADFERIVRKVMAESRPPTPQQTPYPSAYPQPMGLGAQLKDMVEAMTAMKTLQGTTDLKAEIEKMRALQEIVGGNIGGNEKDNSDLTFLKFLETINSAMQAKKQTPQQIPTPPPITQPEIIGAPTTDTEDLDMEETLTDEALKGMAAQIPASWAKKILSGEIQKPAIDGFMQLKGLMPLTVAEFEKALIFLQERFPNFDQKNSPKPKSPKKPEALMAHDSTDSQEQKS